MHISLSNNLRNWLHQQIQDNAYPGYVYGYPHKKAYRDLETPRRLEEVWEGEDVKHLSCYLHIPFCTQRCSFCNLFTYVPGTVSPTRSYLDALAREMERIARAIPGANFQKMYWGGGTPTFLDNQEIHWLVSRLESILGVSPKNSQSCIEASPETLTGEKIEFLKTLGFQRISLGIQSLIEEELRAVNRRFSFDKNFLALQTIDKASFSQFNVDLIYGLPGQTNASWEKSIHEVLAFNVSSVFLYPLYIRPMTGLDSKVTAKNSLKPSAMASMYDLGVEILNGAGFIQVSMRQFRRDHDPDELEYSCQQDGMVGLGAGARSYTRALHYATPWKMKSANIREVVEAYCQRSRTGEFPITHGFNLNWDEQWRRFVIMTLLFDGLDLRQFHNAFQCNVLELGKSQWEVLEAENLIEVGRERIRLTKKGMRYSDIVGQVFFSTRVQELIDSFEYD